MDGDLGTNGAGGCERFERDPALPLNPGLHQQSWQFTLQIRERGCQGEKKTTTNKHNRQLGEGGIEIGIHITFILLGNLSIATLTPK